MERGKWLVELHRKLWGRKNIRDQIFRSIEVTEDNFWELQKQLQSANKDRDGEEYEASNVLDTKLKFLHALPSNRLSSHVLPPDVEYSELLRSFESMDTSDPSSTLPAGADMVNTARASNPPANPSGSDGDDSMDIDHIIDHNFKTDSDLVLPERTPADFSNPPPIFPYTIHCMDLSDLKLERFNRLPPLTLIRDEWRSILDCVNDVHKRFKGLQGSILITGQPGIGKYHSIITCHLI
jgi:hypothetical protein